jgi:hypothetical protein
MAQKAKKTELLPERTIPAIWGQNEDQATIVQALTGYKHEAEENRKGGMNPRDAKWGENLDLYWGRYNFQNKASWQAKEVMPEVSSYVDRFAAAMKEALIANPDGFYSVEDPADSERDMTRGIKRMTDVWLTTVGRNQTGTPIDFTAVFEEQMKVGALMAMSSVVLWKDDVPDGRVAIETVDPRNVWLDHTYRDLYRIRRTEIDKRDLLKMVDAKTRSGKQLYNLNSLAEMLTAINTDDIARATALSGTGANVASTRTPIVLDEYRASVVAPDGRLLADDALMIVGNDKYLLRGPEANPFWHGKDWLVFAPMVTVPLSVYGRSYMEDFGSIAKTFNELTNLILDATKTASVNAFVLVPSMLLNPAQANTGVWPNKTFLLEDGYRPEDFAKEIQMGSVDQGAFQVWQALKNELSEAAGINEIGLGQFAPKGRTSATEINATSQNSSALIRSVSQTVESRYLNPTLDLVWKTGLQHAKAEDRMLANAAGPALYQELLARRREIIKRPISFQAKGISSLLKKSAMLQSLLQMIQIISANPQLAAAFMQVVDMGKLVDLLFMLSNVDPKMMQLTEREKLMQQITAGLQQQAGGATPTPGAQAEMGDVASRMGVAV